MDKGKAAKRYYAYQFSVKYVLKYFINYIKYNNYFLEPLDIMLP